MSRTVNRFLPMPQAAALMRRDKRNRAWRTVLAALTLCSLSACAVGGAGGVSAVPAAEQGALTALGEFAVVVREEGSGTRAVFNELTGIVTLDPSGYTVDRTSADAAVALSTSEIADRVAAEKSAIGYLSVGSITGRADVKALFVDGVEATTENLDSGDYALCRSFYLAHMGTASAVSNDFLTYVLGAGQAVVAENYLPVRRSSSFLSDNSAGTITIEGSSSVAPLMEELAAAYMAINKNATVTVSVSDTAAGLTKAMQRGCDFAMSSRPLKDYEQEMLEFKEIAKDGIAVVVHPDNPVAGVTSEQLGEIFSGGKTAWEQLYE